MKPTILAIFVAVAIALPASAATITWQTPQNIAGESDVYNLGLVVTAVNGGSADNADPVVVGGVSFLWDDGSVLTNGTRYSQYDFAPDPTDPDVSDAYDTLLSSTRSYGTNISLSGLQSGTKYAVQIWVNDSRSDSTAARQTSFTAGNTSALVQASRDDTEKHLGQYVIGTFTADAATQAITYEGYDGNGNQLNDARYVNALLVTTVPEPGSAGLFGFLLLSAAFLRRRR